MIKSKIVYKSCQNCNAPEPNIEYYCINCLCLWSINHLYEQSNTIYILCEECNKGFSIQEYRHEHICTIPGNEGVDKRREQYNWVER